MLQVLRGELDGLIKAEKVNVTYDLSATGDLTLQGTILDADAADRFLGEVSQNVVGVGKIESKIKTAKSLFADIQKLAHLSEIDDTVVFRLDGAVVDANGVISVNKIDQWVGFLQAYSKRFGDVIGLRSYVQLQSDANAAVAQAQPGKNKPILLGAVPPGEGVDLDINRLKSGDFKFTETFAGGAAPAAGRPSTGSKFAAKAAPPPDSKARAPGKDAKPTSPPSVLMVGPIAARHPAWTPASAPPQPAEGSKDPLASQPSTAQAKSGRSDSVPDKSQRVAAQSDPGRTGPTNAAPANAVPANAASANAGDATATTDPVISPKQSPRPALPASFRHDVGDMTDRAGSLMSRWLDGRLVVKAGANGVAPVDDEKGFALQNALDTLANESLGLAAPPDTLSEASKELFVHKYLPLFALSRDSSVETARQCRPGSRLSLDDLPAALFWLDLMSATNAITLRDFDMNAQSFILEAALNPRLVAECLSRDKAAAALIPNSIYLAEAARNPEFVRFVTQSLTPFSLDVTGASLFNPRFVQLRDGSKLREGEAPDAASRIDTIGELGVSVLLSDGLASVIMRRTSTGSLRGERRPQASSSARCLEVADFSDKHFAEEQRLRARSLSRRNRMSL